MLCTAPPAVPLVRLSMALMTILSAGDHVVAAGALYASQHLIDTNPDAVRTFVAAWIEMSAPCSKALK